MSTAMGKIAYRSSSRKKKSRPSHEVETIKTQVNIGSFDRTIFMIVVILALFGVIMVFSASYYTTSRRAIFNYDMFYFLKKQGVYAVIGFLVMLLASNVSYRYLKRFSGLVYLIACGFLVFVFTFGTVVKGAKRWVEMPIIKSFQPSEIAKVAIIFLLAAMISGDDTLLKTWRGFIKCTVIVGLLAFLVVLGNLSTAIIIAVIGMGIIFIASPYILRFVIMGGAGVGGLVSFIVFLSNDFRNDRFHAWLHPFENTSTTAFQIVQSLYAIGSGGAFGLGIGQSRQKSFLPEAHNDIIFSIICEEIGFVGAAIILLLFAVLIWRGFSVALRAPDTFGSLLAAGITLMIAVQTVLNIAVVTNSIPNTGVPLPFISAGGTSIIVTMGLMGVLLNISRHTREIR